eukprot:5470372-Pleurochrysis_carterae.AAC.3
MSDKLQVVLEGRTAIAMSKAALGTAAAAAAALAAAGVVATAKRRAQQHVLKLTYLDFRGVAEPIRLALTIGDIPFEDVRIGYDGVKALRAQGKLPYGQVPILEIDGVVHSQSAALLRWAGKKAGLYPEELQLKIDAVHECIADINKAILPQVYKHALGRNPLTGGFYAGSALSADQMVAVKHHLNEELLPAKFAQLEQTLKASGGPFMTGAAMTTCDLELYVLGSGVLDGSHCSGISPDVLRDCPGLTKLVKLVEANPKVAEWNQRGSSP